MRLWVLVILLLLSSTVHAEYMKLIWNYTLKEPLSGLGTADLNGNGDVEVVAADSSEGAVYVLNKKGKLIWKYETRGYLHDVYVSDLDNDGYSEILTNTDGSLFMIDHSGNRIWKFFMSYARGGTKTEKYIDIGNLNRDASKEIVVKPTPSRCSENNVLSINATGTRLNTYKLGNYDANTIATADLNNDGVDEIILGTRLRIRNSGSKRCEPSNTRPGKVMVLYANKSTLWEYPTEGGVTALFVSDVDDDANNDILVGSYPNLYVLDNKGKLMWKHSAVSFVSALSAADLNKDGKKEVIIGSDNVYAFSYDGKAKWMGNTGSRVYTLKTVDLNDDGNPEVIVGSDKVYVFDNTGNLVWDSDFYTSVYKLAIADLDGNGYDEVIAGTYKNIYVFETGIYAKKQLAANYYADAKTLYTKKNFTGALGIALEAKRLYSDLGLLDESSRALKLITEINSTYTKILNLSVEGNYYLNKSRSSYVLGNYMNASRYAHIAKIKFSDSLIKDQSSIEECDKFINNSNSFLRINATENYEKAFNLFNNGNHESAKEYAKRSKAIYEFLKDSKEAEKADALLRQISQKRGTTSRFQDFLSGVKGSITNISLPGFKVRPMYLVGAAGLVILIIAFMVAIQFVRKLTRKKKVPKLSLEDVEKRPVKKEEEKPKEPERPKPRVIKERERFTRDSSRGSGLTIPGKKLS